MDVSCWLLFGPPGSGKGTIGNALGALPNFTHCSSGDMIRAAADRIYDGTGPWNEVSSGRLLADDHLWKLFDEYLEEHFRDRSDATGKELLLLDGIPRSKSQVEELFNRVIVRGILHFVCDDSEALAQRIARRFSRSGRSDDASQDIIRTRQHVYHEQTLPLLELYPANLIHRFDATQRPELVLKEVLERLGSI